MYIPALYGMSVNYSGNRLHDEHTSGSICKLLGCTTNKIYYYTNVICIQIVLHWGTIQECGINRGNTVAVYKRNGFKDLI